MNHINIETVSSGRGYVVLRHLQSGCIGVLALGALACSSASTPSEARDGEPEGNVPVEAPQPGASNAGTSANTSAEPGIPMPTTADSTPDDASTSPSSPEQPEMSNSGGGATGLGGSAGFGGASGMGGRTNARDAGAAGHTGLEDAATDEDANVANGGESGDPPVDADCAEAGGLCVVAGECEPVGGTVAPSASGCEFDDASAECCLPPDPEGEGSSCADVGGVCTSIGACVQSGHPAPPEVSCGEGVGIACCVPLDRCGEVDIECCSDGTTYRPACDDGQFVCVAGEPYPLGACPF
jgi:hypothetical protein